MRKLMTVCLACFLAMPLVACGKEETRNSLEPQETAVAAMIADVEESAAAETLDDDAAQPGQTLAPSPTAPETAFITNLNWVKVVIYPYSLSLAQEKDLSVTSMDYLPLADDERAVLEGFWAMSRAEPANDEGWQGNVKKGVRPTGIGIRGPKEEEPDYLAEGYEESLPHQYDLMTDGSFYGHSAGLQQRIECPELAALLYAKGEEVFGFDLREPVLQELGKIRSATLTVRNANGGWDSQTIEAPKSLALIREELGGAEWCGSSACPFEAFLNLAMEDGRNWEMAMATDSCDVLILQGTEYFSDFDLNKIYALFDQVQLVHR